MELSPYLLAVALGWVIAQGLKYVFAVIKTRKLAQFRHLYISGNMPSSHSATTVALATVVGLRDGTDSALFALAALFASVVMYDAMMVRRSVGEQGLAVQQLIQAAKNNAPIPRTAKGHTPLEVVGGLVVGLLIGLVVFLATN